MNLKKYTNDWIFDSNPEDFVSGVSGDHFLSNPDLFKIITESIQDGVCVLDDKLVVQYVNRTMEHWYDRDLQASIGEKCYRTFHDRDAPCDNCPVSKSFETSSPQVGIVHYDTGGEKIGLQLLYSIPIYDDKKAVKFVIEYVKDISIQEQYDQLVDQLRSQIEHLEKQNAVLANTIVERESLHHRSEDHLATSLRQLLEPSGGCIVSNPMLGSFKSIPKVTAAPLPDSEDVLSRREAQICRLIVEDMSSKEIADKLCVVQKTIDFHRSNIRRKFNLDKDTTLVSFLRSQRSGSL